jgi:hypothetical protein
MQSDVIERLNMALEATHIRFALELKEGLNVKNLDDYVVGCLYPDSRYTTRTERSLTHPADYRLWDLSSADDFKKGWYTHLLCDDLQGDAFREKFPQLFTGEVASGNPVWIGLTAIKVLQDIDDVKQFDIRPYLPNLDAARAPNNEDMDVLKSYYAIAKEAYSDSSRLELADYEDKLARLGLGKEYAARVIARAQELAADKNIMTAVRSIFAETIAKAKLT